MGAVSTAQGVYPSKFIDRTTVEQKLLTVKQKLPEEKRAKLQKHLDNNPQKQDKDSTKYLEIASTLFGVSEKDMKILFQMEKGHEFCKLSHFHSHDQET